METAKMCFLRAVTGCKTMDHKCNEDTAKELGITDINTIINK
jgi:hypothetical protein